MTTASVREPKQSRSRRTLRRITGAALELIAEAGVEGTTVHAIVRRADSSVGSFYARFAGKDDLLAYLDERIWETAELRWAEATDNGAWRERSLQQVIDDLAHLYAELDLVHRQARDALALALRGPNAGLSAATIRFRSRVRNDSRLLLLERRGTITHPTPDLAVETVCSTLEASAGLMEPSALEDLCSALVAHLVGGRPEPRRSGGEEVEFFDIWG